MADRGIVCEVLNSTSLGQELGKLMNAGRFPGAIKAGNFFDQLNCYRVVKEDSVRWS
jgi:hypothetical protein